MSFEPPDSPPPTGRVFPGSVVVLAAATTLTAVGVFHTAFGDGSRSSLSWGIAAVAMVAYLGFLVVVDPRSRSHRRAWRRTRSLVLGTRHGRPVGITLPDLVPGLAVCGRRPVRDAWIRTLVPQATASGVPYLCVTTDRELPRVAMEAAARVGYDGLDVWEPGVRSFRRGDRRRMNPFAGLSPDAVARILSATSPSLADPDRAGTKALAGTVVQVFWHLDGMGLVETLSPTLLRDSCKLRQVVDMADPDVYPDLPQDVRRLVEDYLGSLPGYSPDKRYKQEPEVGKAHDMNRLGLHHVLDVVEGGAGRSYVYDMTPADLLSTRRSAVVLVTDVSPAGVRLLTALLDEVRPRRREGVERLVMVDVRGPVGEVTDVAASYGTSFVVGLDHDADATGCRTVLRLQGDKGVLAREGRHEVELDKLHMDLVDGSPGLRPRVRAPLPFRQELEHEREETAVLSALMADEFGSVPVFGVPAPDDPVLDTVIRAMGVDGGDDGHLRAGISLMRSVVDEPVRPPVTSVLDDTFVFDEVPGAEETPPPPAAVPSAPSRSPSRGTPSSQGPSASPHPSGSSPGSVTVIGTDVRKSDLPESWENEAGRAFPLVALVDGDRVVDVFSREMPHAVDLARSFSREAAKRSFVRTRPLLVHGDVGAGKSRTVRRLAEATGLPCVVYPCGGSSDGSFGGTSRQWSTGRANVPLQLVRRTGKANACVILDELDKVGSGHHNGNMENVLLAMTDPETSRRYFDVYLETEVDLSAVTWIATANSVDKLNPALRDRFKVVRLPSPKPEHGPALVRSLVEVACRDGAYGRDWLDEITAGEVDAIVKAWGGGSIRKLSGLVKLTLDRLEDYVPATVH